MRTSTRSVSLSPTRCSSPHSTKRSSLDCSPSGISPISSRNSVPPSAASMRPVRPCTAPVNAPRVCPKSSASSSDSGMAAQLMATNGLRLRDDSRCSASATSSLPEPVGPSISTGVNARSHQAHAAADLDHAGSVANQLRQPLGGAWLGCGSGPDRNCLQRAGSRARCARHHPPPTPEGSVAFDSDVGPGLDNCTFGNSSFGISGSGNSSTADASHAPAPHSTPLRRFPGCCAARRAIPAGRARADSRRRSMLLLSPHRLPENLP